MRFFPTGLPNADLLVRLALFLALSLVGLGKGAAQLSPAGTWSSSDTVGSGNNATQDTSPESGEGEIFGSTSTNTAREEVGKGSSTVTRLWRASGQTSMASAAGVASPTVLVKLSVSSWTTSGAICNDGTPYAFYKSSSPRLRRRWLIFLEGGGLCNGESACSERFKTQRQLMSSAGLPETVTGRDILSRQQEENPAFYDYNHVFLPYCSSDLWLGTRATVAIRLSREAGGRNLTFAGAAIFKAVVDDLLLDGLRSAEQVVLAGADAGAVGAVTHAKWLLSHLNSTMSRLDVLCDSGLFVDFHDGLTDLFAFNSGSLLANVSQLTSCQDFWHGMPCCLSLRCMLSQDSSDILAEGKIRLLLIVSAFDLFSLKHMLDSFLQARQSQQGLIDMVDNYRGWNDDEMAILANLTGVSIFEVNCAQHGYFPPPAAMNRTYQKLCVKSRHGSLSFSLKQEGKAGSWLTMKGGEQANDTLSSAVERWVRRQRQVLVRASCHGLHCQPSCPETLHVDRKLSTNTFVVPSQVSLYLALAFIGTAFALSLGMRIFSMVAQRCMQQAEGTDGDSEVLGLSESDFNIEAGVFSIACLSVSYSVRKKELAGFTTQTAANDASVPHSSDSRQGSVADDTKGMKEQPKQWKKSIIDNVNICFKANTFAAVMGPSGCGKSTFLNLLSGRKAPTQVSVPCQDEISRWLVESSNRLHHFCRHVPRFNSCAILIFFVCLFVCFGGWVPTIRRVLYSPTAIPYTAQGSMGGFDETVAMFFNLSVLIPMSSQSTKTSTSVHSLACPKNSPSRKRFFVFALCFRRCVV